MEKEALETDNEQLQAQLDNLQTQLREARKNSDHFSDIEPKYLQLQESEKSFRIANQNLAKEIEQLKEEAEINEGAMDQLVLMNEETREKYTAQVTELEQQLQAFYDTGMKPQR